MTRETPTETTAKHGFSVRLWNAEHSGQMDDDVAEWFSALVVLLRDDYQTVQVLKHACRELLPGTR